MKAIGVLLKISIVVVVYILNIYT